MDRRLSRVHSVAARSLLAFLTGAALACSEPDETPACLGDCGGQGGSAPFCGDDSCGLGENASNCQVDCGSYNCGDGDCSEDELCGTCAADCGACTGPPIAVVRGPYLQGVTSHSVVIRWRTAEPSASAVAYGRAQLTKIVQAAEPTIEHELQLTDLEPDAKYSYAFGAPASTLSGGDAEHFVVTAPSTGTPHATRIWVVGDAGVAGSSQAAVRDAYLMHTGTHAADLFITLGDNAYAAGTDAEYQTAFFDTYAGVLNHSVLWPTLGERDGTSAESATQSGPYYDMFTLPTEGEAGGVASGTEAYYSFDYGHIHFVCLDSAESNRATSGEMLSWLHDDLDANQQQRWLVAFWHHPPYSKGLHDSDTEIELAEMRQNAVSMLEAYGVDLVLAAHSNGYERSFYLHAHVGTSDMFEPSMLVDGGDGRVEGDGPYVRPMGAWQGAVYVVAGSSGQVAGGALNHPAMFMSLAELGSVVVDVDGDTMKVTFVDAAAAVRDWFTIVKL